MEDIFKKDLSGAMVSPDDPGYDKLIGAIFDSMKLAYALNDGFYVDYGKNIRFGKRCWIQ